MTEKIEHAPVKPAISIEVLEKLDIRVGTILRVEDLPRSKTVSVLTVDFGDHQRTILSSLRGKGKIQPRSKENRLSSF